jgi:CRP-like cAMP-binding protein
MGHVKFFDGCQDVKQQVLDEYFVRVDDQAETPNDQWHASDKSNFFLIESGEVAIYQNDPKEHSTTILFNTYSADDFFGEIAMIHDVRSAGHIAKKNTKLWKLKGNNLIERRQNLQALFAKYPQIAFNVVSDLSWRLFRSNRYTASHDVRSRLKYLFAIEQAENAKDEVKLSLRQIELMIGVARNSVKTNLRAMVTAGILSVTKDEHGYSYKVINKDKLLTGIQFKNS